MPFDFAIIATSGIRGTTHLVLVVLGPVTGDDHHLSEVIAELHNAYGPSAADTERPYASGPGAPRARFPHVYTLAEGLLNLTGSELFLPPSA